VILDPPMEMPSDGGVHPDVGGAPRVMRAHLPERPSLPEPTNWTWENATEGDNENASIVLTDIRAPPYFRLAFTGKRNRLKITLANIDTHKYIVRADIYEIGPDGVGKTYLRTLNYGCIKPGRDKTRQMWWTPTETGRNWIYGEIYVKERHGNRWLRAGHFRESFNVVPGWREVVEIDGDYVVSEPTVIDNVTLIVHGDIYANAPLEIRRSDVIAGNLTVSDITTIYGDSSVDIAATYDGQYKVEVMPSGTLEVYGKIWNNPDTVYYNFWMNGTLLIDKDPYAAEPGVVENVNGNATDLSAPGGVVCIESNGTVTIRNGGTIRNGKTHGLYLYRTDAFLIGANISNNGGYGLYAVESAPVINNSLFQNNRVGIYLKDSLGGQLDPWGEPVYTPGMDLGYFVWYDADGWHVRWSGNGTQHRFNGTVSADGITSFTVAGMEYPPDTWLVGPTTIEFEAYEDTGAEGFDFTVTGDSVTFDLWVDGERTTTHVYIGEGGVNPRSIPFTLTPALTYVDIVATKTLSCADYGMAFSNSTVRVTEYSNASSNSVGIYAMDSTVVIERCDITQNMEGIMVDGGYVEVHDTIFCGNGRVALTPLPPPIIAGVITGGGLHIADAGVNISGNLFMDEYSIMLGNVSGTVRNNAVILPSAPLIEIAAVMPLDEKAILIGFCTRLTFTSNLVLGGGGGYSLSIGMVMDSSRIPITDNVFSSTGRYEFQFRETTWTFVRNDTNFAMLVDGQIYTSYPTSGMMNYQLVIRNSTATVVNNVFNNSEYGITAYDSDVDFANNSVTTHRYAGLYVEGGQANVYSSTFTTNRTSGVGMWCVNSQVNISSGNVFRGNYIGAYFTGCDGYVGVENTLDSNTVKDNVYGLYVHNSSINVVNNFIGGNLNPITREGAGVVLTDSNAYPAEIRGNRGPPSYVCIYVYNSTASIVNNNFTLYGNATVPPMDYTGIEGVNSTLQIYGNALYGLHADEANITYAAGIKLVNCTDVTLSSNVIMPSTALGAEGYPIEVAVVLENTTATLNQNRIGGDKYSTLYGIIAYGSHVSTAWDTVRGTRLYGIFVKNSTLLCSNDTISDNAEYGLYAAYSRIRVENSTFSYNGGWAVWCMETEADIIHSTFDRNLHGIYYGDTTYRGAIRWNTVKNHTSFRVEPIHLDRTVYYTYTPVGYGIFINNTCANVSDNAFTYNAYGIFYYNSSGNILSNTFEKNLWKVIIPTIYKFPQVGGECIVLSYSDNIMLDGNTIADAYRGLAAEESTNITATNTQTTNVWFGIAVMGGSVDIEYNTIHSGMPETNYTIGISLNLCSGTVLRNDISGFTEGIRFGDVGILQVTNNYILNNTVGMQFVGTMYDGVVSFNEIAYNEYGVNLSATSYVATGILRYNNIEYNAIYGAYNANTTYIVDMTRNWWGDPSGPYPLGTGNPINEYVDASNPLSAPVNV